MTRRAPSPMWVEVSIGVSLKAGPPAGGGWTVAALAARHAFEEAAVVRAIEALADDGHAEAIELKSNLIAASIPVAVDAEGAAPRGSNAPAPSVLPSESPAKAFDDGAVTQTAASEGASRLAGGRTPVGAGEVDSLASPAPSPSAAVAARSSGSSSGATAPSLKVAIEAAMLAEPEDGFAFLRRKWPDLLRRLVAASRADETSPGPMMARVISAGLDALGAPDAGETLNGAAA